MKGAGFGAYVGWSVRFENSTNSISNARLSLIKRIVDALSLHPYGFLSSLKGIHPLNHQLELLTVATFREPVRAFIADEVGLGKTLEAALLVKYYQLTRDFEPLVLIVVPRILLEQWKEELRDKFGVNVVEITKDNLKELSLMLRDRWYLISIDKLKRSEYLREVSKVRWNFVIVDEAHKLGSKKGRTTQRYRAIESMCKYDDLNLILLSATPHRGDPYDYLSRLKLIDPYLIEDLGKLDSPEFYSLTKNALVIRRTKLDVNEVYEKRNVFKNAKFKALIVKLSPEEKRFYEEAIELVRNVYKRKEKEGLGIVLTILAKRISSSPLAAQKTLLRLLSDKDSSTQREVIEKLEESLSDFYDYEEEMEPDELLERIESISLGLTPSERTKLEELIELSNEVAKRDTKLSKLIKYLTEHMGRNDVSVVFTEYKDTAEYLYGKLSKMEQFKGRIALITSKEVVLPKGIKRRKEDGLSRLKNELGRNVKVLIATDVASEGLNLQKANVIINYELVWSPVKLEQRLGRVWRYGQEREVTSYVMMSDSRIDSDVLNVLYSKLLAMSESIEYDRNILGEEIILVDNFIERGTSTSPPVLEDGMEFNELKAISEYLKGGRKALEEYVRRVSRKIVELNEVMRNMSLRREERAKYFQEVVEKLLGGLEANNGKNELLRLIQKVAELRNLNSELREGRIIVRDGTLKREDTNPMVLLRSLLEGTRATGDKLYFIAPKSALGRANEIRIFEVEVALNEKRVNRSVYKNLIGVRVTSEQPNKDKGFELMSAIEVLRTINDLADLLLPVEIKAEDEPRNAFLELKLKLKNTIMKTTLIRAYPNYLKKSEEKGYARKRPYIPKDASKDLDIKLKEIARIYAVEIRNPIGDASEKEVEEIEKIAMEKAMEYEKLNGRQPTDVSRYEHYDIYSIDPRTGEERYIEVKGRQGTSMYVELTKKEMGFALKNRDKYWLYIVINVKKNPLLIAIRDPVNFMEEICETRYVPKL
ncbi:hypothetical protein EYM_01195 [Ignicoccus islandicus DSM 13165]|uniref:Helicase n=1 Tax=Ignicoccus islandicus DSM 13165 TaxID=940295 RepID=A0A0U3DXF7_9CREN|nr:DUF3883 domain-containing protein [Ignicoccus islandicus]ALU12186.1 hypothetical protein EYM_01195 [Ignicoccus islandicus DSM 13165]